MVPDYNPEYKHKINSISYIAKPNLTYVNTDLLSEYRTNSKYESYDIPILNPDGKTKSILRLYKVGYDENVLQNEISETNDYEIYI
jgi:hypothetical protein